MAIMILFNEQKNIEEVEEEEEGKEKGEGEKEEEVMTIQEMLTNT